MHENQENLDSTQVEQDDITQKSEPKSHCPEIDCFDYIEKLYKNPNSQPNIKSCCRIANIKQEIISKELEDRRCLLEKEIIGNCEIAQKLSSIDNPASADRIYKLSATDLFVEKAIHLLDEEAQKHEKRGNWSFTGVILIVFLGVTIALFQMYGTAGSQSQIDQTLLIQQATQQIKIDEIGKEQNVSKINENVVKTIVDAQVGMAWKEALMTFTKSFTFYGLLILSAVFLKRQGKASLDQAERIKDKRHALREGRLYIHLKNGQIKTVEELEQAFNWNSSQQNAFSDINTEAQAPWGTVFKGITETFTKTVESLTKNRNSGETK